MAATPPPNDPSSSHPSSTSIAASSSSQLVADRRAQRHQYRFFNPREDDDTPAGDAIPSPVSSPLRLQGRTSRMGGAGDGRRRGGEEEDDRALVARVFNIRSQLETSPAPPVETKHSIYNRADDSETFPIDVPDVARDIIVRCIAAVFKITEPRPFQIFVIHCMVCLQNQLVYVIRKTGEGETLVVVVQFLISNNQLSLICAWYVGHV